MESNPGHLPSLPHIRLQLPPSPPPPLPPASLSVEGAEFPEDSLAQIASVFLLFCLTGREGRAQGLASGHSPWGSLGPNLPPLFQLQISSCTLSQQQDPSLRMAQESLPSAEVVPKKCDLRVAFCLVAVWTCATQSVLSGPVLAHKLLLYAHMQTGTGSIY